MTIAKEYSKVSNLVTFADVLSFKSSQDEGVVSSNDNNNLDSRLRGDVESPKEQHKIIKNEADVTGRNFHESAPMQREIADDNG